MYDTAAVSKKYSWKHNILCGTIGGIIWEVEGRGSGSKGVAYYTDSPTQVEDLIWIGVCGIPPKESHSPNLQHPNNTACVWH